MNSPAQNRFDSGPSVARLIFQNTSTNYLVIVSELLIGIVMLPFNVSHLGQSAYGLWVLIGSITVYFSMLDMGYGVAQVRFAAKYRAQNDSTALNEIASTMFCIFGGVGLLTLATALIISLNLARFFPLSASQVRTGQIILLVLSAYVALGFPVSVFGGIVNGFQRQYLNGGIAFGTALIVAVVNVIVLRAGYGLVELVVATTIVRTLSYAGYALNAYRVCPSLRISPASFRRERLREVTGFSVFILIIDIANKLNYSTDAIVVGAFLGTGAVAIWAIGQRLIDIVQRVTDQLNGVLFPVVVESATIQREDRLQTVLLQGTRLSLGMVVPLATILGLTARPLVLVWVGPTFMQSVDIIYLLAIVVALRVGSATSAVVLKGSGNHQFVAFANLGMAAANLGLSVLLVRKYGLIGVAVGTLIPMVVMSVFVLFPRACRRVGLPVWTVFNTGVWPAMWPALFMAAFLVVSTRTLHGSWLLLLLQVLTAGAVYGGLFLRFAISRTERAWYVRKARLALGRASVAAAPNELGLPS